ncbi:PepSY-associated TM helix domain-containing protein [Chondromyces crocatus]|uniref:Peptidase n=1 Tax=Chondromyces crocatus TaxID=52 RepID=A0A0K1EQ56_CHOCO|nr:PepSY-associated TM helix domain-containing protein [Chondromyces crocatus]AKT42949.1 peptidase [Chondromyces crocatus]
MKLPFRKALFWVHLVAGVVAGLVVALMSFTGVALAFKPQIMAWGAEQTLVAPPPSAGARRLPLEDVLARVRTAVPALRPTAISVYAQPDTPVLVTADKHTSFHVHAYTGEVLGQIAPGWSGFFQVMEEWHRWLGRTGDQRDAGRAITGVSNAAFLVLAVTGLYLWWPRKWTWRSVRQSVWFQRRLVGKARDWNWHNTIGLWTAPVLVVLTATGMVISYKWASNLVYTLTGSEPPQQAPLTIAPPSPAAKPLAMDALLDAAKPLAPPWERLTLRLPEPPKSKGGTPPAEATPEPVRITVREPDPWPRFFSPQLTLDPYTGALLAREEFADYSVGHQVRRWMRFLHTGEALGVGGQLVAALASLGALFLVWTGLALALRRFARWRKRRADDADTSEASLDTPGDAA